MPAVFDLGCVPVAGCEAACALALEVVLVPAADVLACAVVVAGFALLVFVADESPLEAVLLAGLACANALPAKPQTQTSARAQIAPNPAPPVFTRCFASNGNPSSRYNPPTPERANYARAKKQNPTEAGIVIILRSQRQCQFPLGLDQVTEVFQPGRRFHPAGSRLAGAPGIPRPGRSSSSTPLWQNHLRYLPAAC